MGAYRNVYIGPYVRCKSQDAVVTETFTRCSGCKRYITTPFCSDCGSPRENYEVKHTSKAVSSTEVAEAFHAKGLCDELVSVDLGPEQAGYDFFVPNKKGTPGLCIDSETKVGILEDLFDPDNDMATLWERCQSAILVLNSLYGRENVHIQWGVLLYET